MPACLPACLFLFFFSLFLPPCFAVENNGYGHRVRRRRRQENKEVFKIHCQRGTSPEEPLPNEAASCFSHAEHRHAFPFSFFNTMPQACRQVRAGRTSPPPAPSPLFLFSPSIFMPYAPKRCRLCHEESPPSHAAGTNESE